MGIRKTLHQIKNIHNPQFCLLFMRPHCRSPHELQQLVGRIAFLMCCCIHLFKTETKKKGITCFVKKNQHLHLCFQMTSVYCTVILSLERYVRICYLCQLREWSYPYVTRKNINLYKAGLIAIPVLFYLPKFFELRWVYHKVKIFLVESWECF